MPDVSARLDDLRSEAEAAVAAAADPGQIEELRVRYLGRKSELTGVLRGIRDLPPDQRGPVGQAANQVRIALESLLTDRAALLRRQVADAPQDAGQLGLAAQVADAELLQLSRFGSGGDGGLRLAAQLVEARRLVSHRAPS